MRSFRLIAVAAALAALVLPAQAGAGTPAGTIAYHDKNFDDSDSQIYVARADGTTGGRALTSLTSAPDPSACWNGECAGEFPAWSADGSRVFFGATWTPFFHIWSTRPDGSDPVMEPITHDFDGAPALSNDGTMIAFDGGNEGGVQGIYVRALGSTNATTLTTGPAHGFDSAPDFSPDGTHIVFTRFYENAERVEIWMVNVDGTGLHRLLSGGRRWGDPHFSPDGSKILVQAWDERANAGRNSNEYTIRPDGTGLTALTNEPMGSFAFSGSWSPDGRHIAYVHVTGGDDSLQIRSMDANGNDESLIVDCSPVRFCDAPVWSNYEGALPPAAAAAAARASAAHVSRASHRAAARRLRRAVIRRLSGRALVTKHVRR
jgi:Tol biopolymer transport system component